MWEKVESNVPVCMGVNSILPRLDKIFMGSSLVFKII